MFGVLSKLYHSDHAAIEIVENRLETSVIKFWWEVIYDASHRF